MIDGIAFGANVRAEQDRLNWSSDDLAWHLGEYAGAEFQTNWHHSFRKFRVEAICSGKGNSTSADELSALAAVLGCPVTTLTASPEELSRRRDLQEAAKSTDQISLDVDQ
jgi:hypothetical protein